MTNSWAGTRTAQSGKRTSVMANDQNKNRFFFPPDVRRPGHSDNEEGHQIDGHLGAQQKLKVVIQLLKWRRRYRGNMWQHWWCHALPRRPPSWCGPREESASTHTHLLVLLMLAKNWMSRKQKKNNENRGDESWIVWQKCHVKQLMWTILDAKSTETKNETI